MSGFASACGGGKLVGDAELADALAECEANNGDAPITVFEIETAAAFLLFSRNPADVLLLEVGLGGRLDATNVVERPLASVITRVSIDHRDFLGDTIEQIAGEKAGILKRDVPAVIGDQQREALAVIERQAARMRSPLLVAGENWTATEERGRLVYQDDDGLLDLPAPKLYGRHQFGNAGCAIAALRVERPEAAGLCVRGRHDACRLAGAHAAPVARAAAGIVAARTANSGLTAATMPTAAAPLPTRWPISKSACRGRWFSSSACCRPRTAKAFCGISPVSHAASLPCRSIRTRRCLPRNWRRLPAISVFRRYRAIPSRVR